MKKITLLAMAFTVFAFTACQQEDLLAENDKAKNEADTTTDGIQVVDATRMRCSLMVFLSCVLLTSLFDIDNGAA